MKTQDLALLIQAFGLFDSPFKSACFLQQDGGHFKIRIAGDFERIDENERVVIVDPLKRGTGEAHMNVPTAQITGVRVTDSGISFIVSPKHTIA